MAAPYAVITPVQRAVMSYFKLTRERLCARSQQPLVVKARHIACYLERQEGRSYPEIAAIYNYADHTSVLAAVKHMIERLEKKDGRYLGDVEAITVMVKKQMGDSMMIEELSCPTCGAPVVAELRRQIALLHERINQMGGKT